MLNLKSLLMLLLILFQTKIYSLNSEYALADNYSTSKGDANKFNKFPTTLTSFGDFAQFIPAISGYVMTIYFSDAPGALQLTESLLLNLTATQILKVSINEKRPNGGNNSFPSGHTSGALAGASFIHFRYGLEPALFFYLISGVVGYSRVHAKAHYWHDVIAGAAIGTASSYLFTQKFTQAEEKAIPASLSYSPVTKSFDLNLNIAF